MNAKEIYRLCHTFASADLTWDDTEALDTLRKAGKRLHRLNEHQCNGFQNYKGDWDQVAADKAEKEVDRLIKKINGICDDKKWLVQINTDPRGWPIRLAVPEPEQTFYDISALVNF